jgi:hypothetical protein
MFSVSTEAKQWLPLSCFENWHPQDTFLKSKKVTVTRGGVWLELYGDVGEAQIWVSKQF